MFVLRTHPPGPSGHNDRRDQCRIRIHVAVAGAALLTSSCTTGLGPYAVRADRPDYNQQIVRSANSEMLLNLVRLRYDDTPLFLELGAVVSQYSINSSINGSGQVGWPTYTGSATLGGSVGYSESPTITYTPLAGEDFAEWSVEGTLRTNPHSRRTKPSARMSEGIC